MPDNIKVNQSTDPSAPAVATDEVGGAHYQKFKMAWGPDNTVEETEDAPGKRIPMNLAESAIVGATNEAAPASDTAASGLNGRLQRIAQRLTSLIALLPTALTAIGAFKTGPAEGVITPVTVTVGQNDSAAFDTAGARNMGLIVPSTFDGTTIRFKVSDTLGGTYNTLYDILGVAVSVKVSAVPTAIDVPGEVMVWRYVKISCVTVQVGTDSDFTVILRS